MTDSFTKSYFGSAIPSSPARRNDVDALRCLAVLLLIPFHTARLFDAEPWHVKDLDAPFAAADVVIRLLNIWQMPLLFLLAGMSAAWALERRPAGAFLRERAARLLMPLAIGMLVLVAPQVWIERVSPEVPLRMSPIDRDVGFLAFLPEYVRCCYPQANLSWHHLWFLAYLLVYSLPLALLGRGGGAAALARWIGARPWRLALPGIGLIAIELALRPSFPSSHDLVTDWANHAHYLMLVLIGLHVARHPAIEQAIAAARIAATVGAAAFTILWFAALPPRAGGLGLLAIGFEPRLVARIAAEWCWLLAFLAWGRRLAARPIAWVAAFAPLSLAFYLVHQTVIVILGRLLLGWTGAPAAKFAAIATISALLSLALARVGAMTPLTRIALGMPASGARRPPGPAATMKSP